MLRTLPRSHSRRGAVLIVVLAMLVLFAVLGLSFVLYSESQLSAARSQKLSVNRDTEPNPQLAAEGYLGGLIYDVGDTGDDLMNPIRGHSLARSKYGYEAGVAKLLPFAGSPPTGAEFISFGGAFNMERREPVRFTFDPAYGVFDPERVYGGAAMRTNPTDPLLPGAYASKAYNFTYPDRHDFHLAQMDPSTGRIVLPSFHRPELGSWDPNSGPSYFENQGAAGKFKTLRPRRADGHVTFPAVPMNADGTYTGDVQNMRFTAGVQHNDSFWMDAGGPVLKWRGKQYKAMVAPLVLDLSSRVNLSVAGNLKGVPHGSGASYPSGSTQGWGPWEVNPKAVGVSEADLRALAVQRYGGALTPPPDPYIVTPGFPSLRVNRGRLPDQKSLIDADGTFVAGGLSGPMALPAIGNANPFPRFIGGQQSATQAELDAELLDHPSQFNPLLSSRRPAAGKPGGFGHDSLVGTAARGSDPKGRPAATQLGGIAPSALAAANLITTFSTTQQFGTVRIRTGPNPTDFATLGPVDLNRECLDYRQTPQYAPSALNIFPNGAGVTEGANAHRQNLARDFFLRMAACPYLSPAPGVVDGTNVAYNPATGYLTISPTAPAGSLAQLLTYAQIAANLVDYLDADDVMTLFVWNPDPTNLRGATSGTPVRPEVDPLNLSATALPVRAVIGTELPRLVINEAYAAVVNTPGDPLDAMNPAQRPYRRQHWVELHNPLPTEPAGARVLSDNGGARLMLKQNVTRLIDPVNDTRPLIPYALTPYSNPYRLEVADVPGGGQPGSTTPYSTYVGSNTPSPGSSARAALDTAGVPGMTLRARINDYTSDPAAPTTLATEDERYVVRPVGVAAPSVGPDGGNTGYAVIGPKDQFPAGGVTNTVSLPDSAGVVPDPTAGTPVPPVNALSYDILPGRPVAGDLATEVGKTSVFILRRLLNPYLPPQEDPTAAGFNPYVTVDYVEQVPTADRVNNDHAGAHAAAPGTRDRATVGRDHPYSAIAFAAQTPAAPAPTPPHTFFRQNSNLNAARNNGTNGLSWLTHLDREAVNVIEVLQVMFTSPGSLTHQLNTGSEIQSIPYQWYRGGLASPALLSLLATTPRVPGGVIGGREAGRINLNTLNDPRVLDALFDPQVGNNFSGVFNVSGAGGLWDQMTTSSGAERTQTGRTPGATVYENGVDRPFRHQLLSMATSGRDDSEFRTTPAPPLGYDNPIFLNNAEQTNQRSTYTQLEPLRKIWNSASHTSDSFLVVMTVGFFEVTPTNPAGPIGVTNPPLFGAELFDKVPGDLRAQFAGVLDRSCLSVADPNVAPVVPAARVPFQTRLTVDATAGSTSVVVEGRMADSGIDPVLPNGTNATTNTLVLYTDGEPGYLLVDGSSEVRLRVGYGDAAAGTGNGEWVTCRLKTGPADTPVRQRTVRKAGGALATSLVWGQVVLELTGPLARTHGGGELVTVGGAFGNPGPQPGVTLKQLAARGLVPYFTKMEP